ncbi:MAG: ABC transporter substrate-binding protein [Reyranellaceae bacterium]
MFVRREFIAAAVLAIAALSPSLPNAQEAVKIAVLTDIAGPLGDVTGRGSVIGAELAIEDFGGKVLGRPIQLLSGDHQHKPEVASNIARQWLESDKVDLIADLPNSAIMLAVNEIVRTRGGILLSSGGQAARLVEDACSPYGFQWTTNTYAIASGLGNLASQPETRTWYFVQGDFAFGEAMSRDLEAAVKSSGGQLLGRIKHPPNSTDMSSFLLQAQASGAQAIALMSLGNDVALATRQAQDFGITARQKLVATVLDITEVNSVGLDTVKGLLAPLSYYWDLDDGTRAVAARFEKKLGRPPTAVQIGVYSGVRHYLKAVEAAGTTDRDAVAAKIRDLPVNDAFVKNGTVRPNGSMVHDMILAQVRSAPKPTSRWAVFDIVRTIPGEIAFGPLTARNCKLVQN